MGRKLHTQGCTLHQNELPLRALFKKLDNITTGPNAFGGPLGQRCTGKIHEEQVLRFKSIETPIIDGFFEDGVLKDLSVHQRLLFDYCKGIGSGNIENRWGTHKIGPLNHARWLTLAIRLLCLYTRDSSPIESLTKLLHYIVNVYAPAWFEIKASSKFHDAPRILFNSITRLNLLPFNDVKRIVQKNIQGNDYCLLHENFLYAMVKDEDHKTRSLGLEAILSCRNMYNRNLCLT